MLDRAPGRPYDLYILSDHGQTPSIPYRITYGETLGQTVEAAVEYGVHVLAETGNYGPPRESIELFADELEAVASTSIAPTRHLGVRLSRWLRRHYGIFPLIAESVRVSEEKKLVVTYSSSLAHLYWIEPDRPLGFDEIRADPDRRALHYFLVAHGGSASSSRVCRTARTCRASTAARSSRLKARPVLLEGEDPLVAYAPTVAERRALVHLVQLPNAGDLVLFGAYDPVRDVCICFDDQVGAHGAIGGRQFWPFIMAPAGLIPR